LQVSTYVTVTEKLSVTEHVDDVIKACALFMYVITRFISS